jgi:DNA-binding transcriptional MerR regulator
MRNNILTIGLFAQAGQVTVQALRHYDRPGLLKPGQVDSTATA